jgi:hypothetical protein
MKYQKKPLVVEAIKYHIYNQLEIDKIKDFMGSVHHHPNGDVYIDTLEGKMIARPGDWIIKGVKGEFYPCKSEIFDLLYDAII